MVTAWVECTMRRFCLRAAALLLCLPLLCALSCARKESSGTAVVAEVPASMRPAGLLAVLEAGEFPLWFQFTAGGAALIETIEDACFSAALVPWPLAVHSRFMLAKGSDLLMAVNGGGFVVFSPGQAGGQTALYHFSGGEFWRQYTVGAFFLLNEKPTALLYRDDRFLDPNAPPPSPRLWALDMYAGMTPQSLIPLDAFAPRDGWDIDAFRRGGDGFWYFRAVKKMTDNPELHMLRSSDLMQEGEKVSLGDFQNAALPEPITAAPILLAKTLGWLLDASGCGIITVVGPEFQAARTFATDREKPALFGFFSSEPEKTFLLTVSPQGDAYYWGTDSSPTATSPDIRRFSLSPLPENFAYTGIALCGNVIIATWEEQDEYSIGAAGFMVIRMNNKIGL